MAVLRALGLPALLPAAAVAASAAGPSIKSCNSSHRGSSVRTTVSLKQSARVFKNRFFGSPHLLQGSLLAYPVAAGAAMVAVEATASLEVSQMAPGQGNNDTGAKAQLSDLMTEFMVDMKCDGCVKSVRTKLEPLDGVKSVEISLENQVVRVLGSTTVKDMTAALAESGRKARLIGQGLPENFTVSAAVAEFKGPQIHGVVRFAQVSMELLRVEASFSGLPQGSVGWSINEYGDLTRGAASTGPIFSGSTETPAADGIPSGDLGVLEVNHEGIAEYSGTKEKLQVRDLIGRALVVYEDADKSNSGISAAVIARSAGVGENYKKLCLCDGTVIWESTNNDFVKA